MLTKNTSQIKLKQTKINRSRINQLQNIKKKLKKNKKKITEITEKSMENLKDPVEKKKLGIPLRIKSHGSMDWDRAKIRRHGGEREKERRLEISKMGAFIGFRAKELSPVLLSLSFQRGFFLSLYLSHFLSPLLSFSLLCLSETLLAKYHHKNMKDSQPFATRFDLSLSLSLSSLSLTLSLS